MRSAFAVPLTGLCCRRETFERLGGFDAACGDLADADFCLRALNGDGLRSVVLPTRIFSPLASKSPEWRAKFLPRVGPACCGKARPSKTPICCGRRGAGNCGPRRVR